MYTIYYGLVFEVEDVKLQGDLIYLTLTLLGYHPQICSTPEICV